MTRLDNREDIIKHVEDYFISLYEREAWDRPLLDNLAFGMIGDERVQWLERDFEEK